VKKISLPQEGIETLYGAHDGNLKHIESLLGVAIRTQGDELIVEGEKASEQRVERLFDQLANLMAEGYELKNGDVKTATQLVADDATVNLHFLWMQQNSIDTAALQRFNPNGSEGPTRDGVTVAVSTEGRAPALAGLLREALEAVIPEDVATWVEEARRLRERQKAEGVPLARRRPLLLEALNRLYASRSVEPAGPAEIRA